MFFFLLPRQIVTKMNGRSGREESGSQKNHLNPEVMLKQKQSKECTEGKAVFLCKLHLSSTEYYIKMPIKHIITKGILKK